MKGIYRILSADNTQQIPVFSMKYDPADDEMKVESFVGKVGDKLTDKQKQLFGSKEAIMEYFGDVDFYNHTESVNVNIGKNENIDKFIATHIQHYNGTYANFIEAKDGADENDVHTNDNTTDDTPDVDVEDIPDKNESVSAIKNQSFINNSISESKRASKNKNTSISKLPTEKRMVKDKDGAYIRDQHVSKKEDGKFEFGEGDKVTPLAQYDDGGKKIDGGINETYHVKAENGKSYFMKPEKSEKQAFHGSNVRNTIRLNDKNGNQARIRSDHPVDPAKHKGTMADREEMAYKLSKEVGMDHLPETKKVDYNHKDVNGRNIKDKVTMMRDVNDVYGKQFDKIEDIRSATHTEMIENASKDPKIGDKAIFDYMIGNTDRHAKNYFIGKKEGSAPSMIAIDNGLSFPNDNRKYLGDQGNQMKLNKNLSKENGVKGTKEFANNVMDFYKSGKMEEFAKSIEKNIGHNEADAFVERIGVVLSSAIKKGYVKV